MDFQSAMETFAGNTKQLAFVTVWKKIECGISNKFAEAWVAANTGKLGLSSGAVVPGHGAVPVLDLNKAADSIIQQQLVSFFPFESFHFFTI